MDASLDSWDAPLALGEIHSNKIRFQIAGLRVRVMEMIGQGWVDWGRGRVRMSEGCGGLGCGWVRDK